LFPDLLSDLNFEVPIDENMGRIDATLANTGKDGFFKKLKEVHDIICQNIIVECKNYDSAKKKLNNTDFQQIADRFKEDRGKFGILVCRDKGDEKDMLKQCKSRKKSGYIVVLDDKDIKQLIKRRFENGESGVVEFFDNKIIELEM